MANKEVKRRAYTSHLTRAINTLNEQLTEDTPDEQKITALIEAVQLKFKKVEEIADILQNDMEETALEADIEKMDALENQVIEVKVKARATLERGPWSQKGTSCDLPIPLGDILVYILLA